MQEEIADRLESLETITPEQMENRKRLETENRKRLESTTSKELESTTSKELEPTTSKELETRILESLETTTPEELENRMRKLSEAWVSDDEGLIERSARPDYEKIEKEVLEKALSNSKKPIILDLRSGAKIDGVVESLLKKKDILKEIQTDDELIVEYKKNQEALARRNKEYTELRLKRREARLVEEKTAAERKVQAQKLIREKKQSAREQVKAERRQQHQTAVALEDRLSDTMKHYEGALAQGKFIGLSVSKLEVKAKFASKEAKEARLAFERAEAKHLEAVDQQLRCDKRVLMAKSPKLDANIAALRERLQSESRGVQEAWSHVNPKKRRKELMNNNLRKQVRDILK